jgi:nuclear pore complex protein Nup210
MTQKLLFKRGNLVGDDHRLPSVAEAWLPVICSIPSSIVLIADEPGRHFTQCFNN